MHQLVKCCSNSYDETLTNIEFVLSKGKELGSVPAETLFLGVILRSPADGGTTKNLMVRGAKEILCGVYPERLDLRLRVSLSQTPRRQVLPKNSE